MNVGRDILKVLAKYREGRGGRIYLLTHTFHFNQPEWLRHLAVSKLCSQFFSYLDFFIQKERQRYLGSELHKHVLQQQGRPLNNVTHSLII